MWTFKFSSHKLAEKWVALFQEVQEKCVARSIKSKDSKSTGFASEYSSILQNISLMDSFSAEKEEGREESEGTGRARRVQVKKIEE